MGGDTKGITLLIIKKLQIDQVCVLETSKVNRWFAIAFIYTIEYQKRGLLHAHILVINDPEDKPQNLKDYDRIISAEIPDRNLYPLAYDTVTGNMIHGLCGTILNPNAPYMDKILGCTKKIPKQFAE